jgi:hypothetical protein
MGGIKKLDEILGRFSMNSLQLSEMLDREVEPVRQKTGVRRQEQ